MKQTLTKIIGISCLLLLLLNGSYQLPLDPSSELSQRLDKAALDLLRSYDEERNAKENKRRLSLQKDELIFRNVIPMQTLVTSYPADIVKMSIKVNPKVTVHLLAIANQFKSPKILNSTVDIYRFNSTSQMFSKIRGIPAVGPYELEFLSVKSANGSLKNLLVVAGNSKHMEDPSAVNTRLAIYEIICKEQIITIKEFQHFDSVSVDAVTSFDRNNQSYLVIGMRLHSNMVRDYPAKVLVLRFNKQENHFEFHSTMAAQFIGDIESLNVEEALLLFVAYRKDKYGNHNLKSPVYRFNDKTGTFSLLQTIPTNGVNDVEPFSIMNEHFLVIASKDAMLTGLQSSVYKYVNNHFTLVEYVPPYSALRWKSAVIPDCKDIVLLAYASQRDNVDQIGFSTYREGSRKFERISLSLYDSKLGSFRPMPRTIAMFMIDEELFIAVGATNITHGHTIYKIEYLNNAKATSTEHLASDIINDMEELQQNLTMLSTAVESLERSIIQSDINLANFIKGSKVFKGNFQTNSLLVKNLDIINGTLSLNQNKSNAKNYVSSIFKEVSDVDKQIDELKKTMDKAQMIDVKGLVRSDLNFSTVQLKTNVTSLKDIVVPSCIVSGVNVCHLKEDVVSNGTKDTIAGTKTFSDKLVMEQNLLLKKKLNNVSLAEDLVNIKDNQVITAKKIFGNGIDLESVKLKGKLNGIALENETLSLHKNETIGGMITLNSTVDAGAFNIQGYVDNVNVTELKYNTMDLFSKQNITGKKSLAQGSTAYDNIKVSNLTNSLDLGIWSSGLINIKAGNSALNDVIFQDNMKINGNVTVSGKIKIHRLSFPEDIVLVRGKQDITGRKQFNAELKVMGNLKTSGVVDNINLNDTVTVSKTDIIKGIKTFKNSTRFLKNIVVAKSSLINSVDLSEFRKNVVTLHEKQVIKGQTSFIGPLTAEDCLTVNGYLDTLPVGYFDSLFKNAMLSDSTQTIKGQASFIKNVTANQNMTVLGSINGFDIPRSFLYNSSNQIINSSTTLENATFYGNVRIPVAVHGFNLYNFEKDLIKIDSNQLISGRKEFTDNTNMDMIDMCCNINNFKLTQFLTKNTSQEVSAAKTLTDVQVKTTLHAATRNVTVQSTVDGIDLSDFNARVLYRASNTKFHPSTKITNAVMNKGIKIDYINGVSLKMLQNDLVTIDTDQTIPSTKIFENVLAHSGLLTSSSVDNIDVSEVSTNAVRKNETVSIGGEKTFQHIQANNVDVTGQIHDVNISELLDITVMRTKDSVISGIKTINGKVTMTNDVRVEGINGLKVPEDFVLRSVKQTITGKMKFLGNITVNGDVKIHGLVNNQNISLINRETLFKSKEQHIRGRKVISSNVESNNDVSIGGKIQEVDLSHLDETTVKISGNVVLRGAKTFASEATFQRSLSVKGTVNNHNWDSVTKDAVLNGKRQAIRGPTLFKGTLSVTNDVLVEGDGVTTGLINNVNISLLNSRTLKTDSNQIVTGKKVFKQNVSIRSGATVEKIHGKETKNFVMIDENQTIEGRKTFSSIQAVGDVTVDENTDGEKLANIAADTLLKSQSKMVTGVKNFANAVLLKRNLTSLGLIDSRAADSNRILTLSSIQSIQGRAIFNNDVIANDVAVRGSLSGSNISEIKRDRITLNTKQQIKSNVVIAEMTSAEDIFMTGKANGIDLMGWQSHVASFVSSTTAKYSRVSNFTQSKCPAFNYMKKFLRDFPLYIDYAEMKQSFQYGINHIESFKIGEDYFIAIVRTLPTPKVCTPTEVMLLNRTNGQYGTYQLLSPALGSRFKSFKKDKEIYLFLENAENDCMPKGQSILYKWNTTTLSFQIFQHIATGTVKCSNLVQKGNDTYLAIANAMPVLSANVAIWMYWKNESKFVRVQTIAISSPAFIEFFKIEDKHFMAVANSYDPVLQSSSTLSLLFKLNTKLNQWERLQGIPTTDAFDVKYVQERKQHYLAFTSGNLDVYRYFNTTGLFTYDHSLKVTSPIEVQTIPLQNVNFFVIVSKDTGISLYRQRLHFEYELVAVIPQTKITHVTSYQIGNQPFLAIGSQRNPEDKTTLGEFFPRILEPHVSGIRSPNTDGC